MNLYHEIIKLFRKMSIMEEPVIEHVINRDKEKNKPIVRTIYVNV